MRAPSSRTRRLLRPLTLPASRIYAGLIAARNRRFDHGEGVQRIDRPVISIGNITTGGTGKTPMVAWIALRLLEAGHKPVIAMRGYKARPGERGDEELEYRAILPGVEVLANPDRLASLREFLPRHPKVDCVLLDDGFQHRQLHRDLDMVLIDADSGTLQDELLPAGNLREPPQNLARADAVIVTHATQMNDDIAHAIERFHTRQPLAWARHQWKGLHLPFARNEGAPVATDWLRGKRVVTMLGVGKPASVIAQIEALGAKVMADIPCADHERFDHAKLLTARGLCDGGDGLFVTHKDWVKLEPLISAMGNAWTTPVIVPILEMDIFAGASVLRRVVVETIAAFGRSGGGAAR